MKRAVVAVVVLTLLSLTTNAIGAARYCGKGTKFTVSSVTHFVGPAWDRPGWRQMQTRRLWSATPTYYQCRP